MANGLPGPPLGNKNGAKPHLLTNYLRIAAQAEDGARLRKGCELIVKRFAEDGNLRDGEFIRDTLQGRPKQQIEATDGDGNVLKSLSVLFVDAATRLAQAHRLEHRVIDAEQQVQRSMDDKNTTPASD